MSNGSVDLIGTGSNDLYPGNGLYLDLDGTSFDAAVLTSTLIALGVGMYQLQFDLGINYVTGPNNSMLVTLATYSESFADANAGPPNFNTIVRNFNVTTAGSYALVFDHAGGDNGGLILDNVSVSRVIPEPATLVLLGLGGACLARRRVR